MHLLAQTSFGTQPHDVADNQHPDHEFGIDRRPAGVTVETEYFFVQTSQIQEAINPSEKVIGRDMRLEIELVEQPGVNLLPSKHRKPSRSP